MTFYTNYHEAHTAAVLLARETGKEVGLERDTLWGTVGFRIFRLPRPENRYGYELRCEVIKPTDPLGVVLS